MYIRMTGIFFVIYLLFRLGGIGGFLVWVYVAVLDDDHMIRIQILIFFSFFLFSWEGGVGVRKKGAGYIMV